MVKKHLPIGLIATTRADLTPLLDDVVHCCGWPLLLEASPRRLARELSLYDPECVLFWLDDRQGLAPTARLVEWSRQRGARPYRLAVAFRLDSEIEAVLRAAGAHTFLSIADRSAVSVADALRPLFAAAVRPAAAAAEGARPWTAPREPVVAVEMRPDLGWPP